MRLPTGFLPTEDQGYAIVGVQLPDAASQVRTREVVDKVEAILKETPGVGDWVMIGGSSVLDQADRLERGARSTSRWTPWEERTGAELSQDAILANLRGRFAGDPGGDRLRLPAAGHPGPGRRPAASRCSSRTAAASA